MDYLNIEINILDSIPLDFEITKIIVNMNEES